MPRNKKDIAALVAIAVFLVFCVCFTKMAHADRTESGEMIQAFSASDEASGEASAEAPTDAFFGVLSETPSEPSAEASSETSSEAGDWRLRLVNRSHPVSLDYAPALTQLINGQAVDERCYPDLQEMMDSCRATGLEPLICSSYRSRETQTLLYENKIQRLIDQGYDIVAACRQAGTVVAVPGTSEHQLGLAVDIVDLSNQNLDESQEDTAVQKWLMTHSWEYGWILRYPNDKSKITGIVYEPWHYRYVGREAAAEIHALGICLEEYLDQAESP